MLEDDVPTRLYSSILLLLDELEELLNGWKTDYEQKVAEHLEVVDSEAEAFWRGGSVTCFKLLRRIELLKKKYEVL